MKKLFLLLFLIPIVSFGQKIKSVESFDISSIKNKKEWKKYKNGFDTNELKVEFGVFKVGSDLTLGYPSNKEISTDFKLVAVNKFSVMGTLVAIPMNNNDSNLEILIERIRVYRPAMGQPMKFIVDFKRKDGANIAGMLGGKTIAMGKFGHTFDLSGAIRLGEIINPNAPLNREQAIAKLKEAKDLLELDMMSKEEFEALKSELSPIIRGN